MRGTLAVAVSFLLGAGSLARAEGAPVGSSVRITYVANEGFLVSAGDTAVLVDGLFGGRPLDFADVPAEETLEKLRTGAAPFDTVRVALVTHRHVDHFDPGVATAFLRSRPEADLVGPPQVVERLEATPGYEAVASRVHTVPAAPGSDTSLTFADVKVRALGLPHGPYMVEDESTGEMVDRHRHTENLGYVVSVSGFTFLHNGDANLLVAEEYCRFDLDPPGLDVAFLGGLLWPPVEAGLETVQRCLAPRHVVLMHLRPDQKTAVGKRIEALDGPHPPLVVPGEPMAEVVLRRTRDREPSH
jgi:L-ascorbate metabolism protein UlaG (beta-lactamase superfamily)